MLLGILKESAPGETRVALLPGSLKSLIAQGTNVLIEAGAGEGCGVSDQAYIDAGARVTADRASILANATRICMKPKSRQNATFTWGIPLPAASGLTNVRIKPAMIDATRIVARLNQAKVAGENCWDGISQHIEKMVLAAFWKATAARPPNNP